LMFVPHPPLRDLKTALASELARDAALE